MTFSGNKIYIYRDEGEKMEGFKTEVNKQTPSCQNMQWNSKRMKDSPTSTTL